MGDWLEDILFLIQDKEGFFIRLCLSVPCSIIAGGFYSSMFPALSSGIFSLLVLLLLSILLLSIMFFSSRMNDFYFSQYQLIALILPVAACLILICSLYSLGVFIAA